MRLGQGGTKMRKPVWSYRVALFASCLLCIGLVASIVPLNARTPPDHGISKPEDFIVHLPWEPGYSSDLNYYSYGEERHTGPDY